MCIRLFSGVALIALYSLAGCQEEGPRIDVESSIPVRVVLVTRGPIEEYLTATATALAVAEAELRCLQAGHYQLQTNPRTGAPFSMGDRVLAGERLFRLDNPEFENQVAIEAKKLHFTSTQREYEKQQALFEKGGITLSELTAGKRNFIDARYAYENARLQLAKLDIQAPFDGVLVDRVHYNRDQLLEAGVPLGRLMDYSRLYAEIALPGTQLGRVVPGQKVLVNPVTGEDARRNSSASSDNRRISAAGDTANVDERGTAALIAAVSPVIDRDSRTFKATLSIANDSLRIRPGMFIKIDIVTASRDSALVIPKDALIDRGDSKVAFVVEKGIALERKLETGLSNPAAVEVLSGLEEEERLVVEGFETLRSRAKVKVEK